MERSRRCSHVENDVSLIDVNIVELPSATVDLIVSCMDSPEDLLVMSQPWFKYLVNWCNTSRARVLSIGNV